jgi:hypothetical protein
MLKLPSSRLLSGVVVMHLAVTGIAFVSGCGPATKTATRSDDQDGDEDEDEGKGKGGGRAESQPTKR